MSRKREEPSSNQFPSIYPKRRRPTSSSQPDVVGDNQPNNELSKSLTTVAVVGLPVDCSVLDLKSRFEIYGSIARTSIDPVGGDVAYITFRSIESANSAIAASLDPSFCITLDSKRVQVIWASDSVPQWKEGVAKRSSSSTFSKLLRAEVPLSKHGRGNKQRNKLGIAALSSRNSYVDNQGSSLGMPLKERVMVAYDDIL